jgi:hypothetical protein
MKLFNLQASMQNFPINAVWKIREQQNIYPPVSKAATIAF